MATIRELKAQASTLQIKGYGTMTKDDLFKAIQRHKFIEEQAEKEMMEEAGPAAEEEAPEAPSTFNVRNVPSMALQGWVWAFIALYNNRNNILDAYCEGAVALVEATEVAYRNTVNLILIAGTAWSILMDDLADYIVANTELDMLKQLGNLIKRGLGVLVDWYQSTFDFAYGSGYFFIYAGSHSFRFNFKPRFSFTHINTLDRA